MIDLDSDAATSKCLWYLTTYRSSRAPKGPSPRAGHRYDSLPMARNGIQPCSSTVANVVVHVRRLLNRRQAKKPQNCSNRHRVPRSAPAKRAMKKSAASLSLNRWKLWVWTWMKCFQICSRLLKNDHLLRCAHHSSLRRTKEYASRRSRLSGDFS